MKKLLGIILLMILSVLMMVSCSETSTPTGSTPPSTIPSQPIIPDGSQKQDFTGLSFSDKIVTYDGSEQSVLLTGNVPGGSSVVYSNNKGTDAGVYNATVTVSKTGYNNFTASATLTINKANFSGLSFSDKTVTYDGTEQEVVLSGNTPAGSQVTYTDNKGTDADEYQATVTVTNKNYNDFTANAVLKIKKANFSGLTFNNKTVTYDGTEQEVLLLGETPAGSQVTYTDNKGTDADEYQATVTVTNKNYNDFTATAVLKIKKAVLSGLTLADQTLMSTGDKLGLEVDGEIPVGASVSYSYNDVTTDGVTDVGEYTVKVTITHKNYETVILNATLSIEATLDFLVDFGRTVISSLSTSPDLWSFLPEGLNKSNFVFDNPESLTYATPYSVSTLPTNFIGKQLNVVYGVTDIFETALTFVKYFYDAANLIQITYQTFINDNPNDYKSFSGNVGGLNYSIGILEDTYKIDCTYGAVQFTLSSEIGSETTSCYVKLTDTTILKYDVTADSLNIAYSVLKVATAQLNFVRENGVCVGHIFHAEGYEDTVLSTSAMIAYDDNYTYVIGKKGDFANPLDKDNRVCEVYDSKTGKYIGSEVKEDATTVVYDTLWIPLTDLTGINSISMIDDIYGKNPDTIYVNGSSAPFEAEYNKLLGVKTSRQYDIEFKTVWVYKYDATSEKYEKVKVKIPMLFVQRENLDTYLDDISANNDGLTVTNNQSSLDVLAVEVGFSLVEDYNAIKDLVTLDTIKEYLGIAELEFEVQEEEQF